MSMYYEPEKINPKLPLWFVADIADMKCLANLRINAATASGSESLGKEREFLEQFPAVFVAVADTAPVPVDEIVKDLRSYFDSMTILTPKPGVFGRSGSVVEVFAKKGADGVGQLILGAVEQPVEGLLVLSKVKRMDRSKMPSCFSTVPEINKILGGYFPGDVNLWSGKRGEGKSTFLGQELLEAVEQGYPVCAYSGELSAPQFKSWIWQQAAGEYAIPQLNPMTGFTTYDIFPEVEAKIDAWMGEKFLLYDNQTALNSHSADSIIRIFEYAVRRYGACIFLVDNLMTVQFNGKTDGEFYRSQGNFARRLKDFAVKFEVIVHFVIHPRKGEVTTLDDIGGSSDVTNAVDNAFYIKRLSKEDAKLEGYSTMLKIMKNRYEGGKDEEIELDFDKPSRRFYRPEKKGALYKHYGWES